MVPRMRKSLTCEPECDVLVDFFVLREGGSRS